MTTMSRFISVQHDMYAEVRERAAQFRQTMAARGTLVVHLLSSPGSGKTSLLEATLRHWGVERKCAVLVGDIATERDAERLRPLAPTIQLTTGGACHLEFTLVEQGLRMIDNAVDLEFLFIENVGNLVCPASHDLGEHLRVSLLSVTEGDDKPGKYPKAFRTSQALVISKIDLLPHVPFSVARAEADARLVQPDLEVLTVSPLTGEGIVPWSEFLDRQRLLLSAFHGDG